MVKIYYLMFFVVLLLSLVSCKNNCKIAYDYCLGQETVFTSTQNTFCSDPQEFFCYHLEKGKVVVSEVMTTAQPQDCKVYPVSTESFQPPPNYECTGGK